jgi:thioredoxin reductase (NADPH)
MSEYLVARILTTPEIEVRTCTRWRAARAATTSSSSCCATARPAARRPVDASWLFVFIGRAPRTDWLGEAFVRDARGFVRTGPDLLDAEGRPPPGWPLTRDPYLLESSVPGVFVAGDVRATSVKRVASAVGEGALAVTLVHRHLGEA